MPPAERHSLWRRLLPCLQLLSGLHSMLLFNRYVMCEHEMLCVIRWEQPPCTLRSGIHKTPVRPGLSNTFQHCWECSGMCLLCDGQKVPVPAFTVMSIWSLCSHKNVPAHFPAHSLYSCRPTPACTAKIHFSGQSKLESIFLSWTWHSFVTDFLWDIISAAPMWGEKGRAVNPQICGDLWAYSCLHSLSTFQGTVWLCPQEPRHVPLAPIELGQAALIMWDTWEPTWPVFTGTVYAQVSWSEISTSSNGFMAKIFGQSLRLGLGAKDPEHVDFLAIIQGNTVWAV